MSEDGEDYVGTDAFDPSGDKLGTVEAGYRDSSGALRYLQLKMGGLFAKHHLVPVDDAQEGDKGLVLPYSKDVVENSPGVSSRAEEIDSETGARVRAYYEGVQARLDQSEAGGEGAEPEPVAAVPVSDAGSGADEEADESGESGVPEQGVPEQGVPTVTRAKPAATASSGAPGIGEIRDLGDVIEIPIVEEEIVKRPVVKEVLRISKRQLVETHNVETTLRKEEAEVDRSTTEGTAQDAADSQA